MTTYRMNIFGGSVFGILPNLPVENIITTVCMAVLGTLTSIFVTVVAGRIALLKRKD